MTIRLVYSLSRIHTYIRTRVYARTRSLGRVLGKPSWRTFFETYLSRAIFPSPRVYPQQRLLCSTHKDKSIVIVGHRKFATIVLQRYNCTEGTYVYKRQKIRRKKSDCVISIRDPEILRSRKCSLPR